MYLEKASTANDICVSHVNWRNFLLQYTPLLKIKWDKVPHYIPKDIYAILYQETLHMWFCVHHYFLSVVKVSNVSRVLCYDAYTYYQMEGSKLWILTIRMQQSCCTKQQQQQKSNILRNGELNWLSYIYYLSNLFNSLLEYGLCINTNTTSSL